MSRLWLLGFAVLLGCDDKGEEPAPPLDTTDTDLPAETVDTGGGDAPDPALAPTDVDADCWAWRTFDSGRDSSIDGVSLYVYDPATLYIIHAEEDFDVDGDVDYIADYTYDVAGRVTVWSYDQDGDGDADLVETAEYDADGLYVRYTYDDGTTEFVYTYVNEGGLRRHIDVDIGDDGTIDAIYDYTYDELGRRTGYEGDKGLDGTIDYIVTYTYTDPTGPDYTVNFDTDADGDAELVETRRYDPAGYVVFYEADDREAGTLTVSEYSYTADGDVATYASEYSDATVVQFEQVTTYTYLEAGMRSTSVRVYAYTLNGDTDDEWAYAWTCPR